MTGGHFQQAWSADEIHLCKKDKFKQNKKISNICFVTFVGFGCSPPQPISPPAGSILGLFHVQKGIKAMKPKSAANSWQGCTDSPGCLPAHRLCRYLFPWETIGLLQFQRDRIRLLNKFSPGPGACCQAPCHAKCVSWQGTKR